MDTEATAVETISPAEAQLRQQSGGFLANGDTAPSAAVVDTQGEAAPAPTPKSAKAPKAAAKDDESFWSQYEKPTAANGAKSRARAKPEVDPDTDFWDQHGQPEAPPPKPVAAVKPKGSLWRSAVDTVYGGVQGLAESTSASAGALNTVAAPLAQSVEAWKDFLTGKVTSLHQLVHQDAPTDWQDAWFKNTVDPTVENAQDFAVDKSAPFATKASHALGAMLGYLSQAILTGGQGAEVTAATTGAEIAAHGVKAAQAPAITQAVNVGREAYQSTGDAELSFKLAATTYGFSVVQNAGPIAMPGSLATRAASGAAISGLSSEAAREATNAIVPEAHAEMRQRFDPEEAVLNLTMGAGMGAIAGPHGMPHQAIERPQNIMEQAQQVAAAAEAAKGGDMLDQVNAATHVNAVLSAHHDAAAFEAHHEVRNQQAAQEAEVQAQEEARASAEQQAAAAKVPETPTTLFERREQERANQAPDKDADFTRALNQKGDQAIEHGDALAAGAEKGGAAEPGPTLSDALSPEQRAAFQSLKERRAAETPNEDVAARLKEQNPEDNFTPYVPPKEEEPAADAPAEGDSWTMPTGAKVEVLKDHEDGTFTIRTTPTDSSQLSRRRKVSGESLGLMKAAATPAEAPQTLRARRTAAGVGTEPLDMSKTPEERALDRERVAALRDRESGVEPQFEPEPIPLRAAEAEGESARRDAADRVEAAAKESAYSPENDLPTPTQAQYEAGNYQKGHVDVQGMPVTIEHPAGSERPLGNGETRTMEAHYGYVKGTVAADGQHVDMLLGKNPANETHFIVDHMNGEGYEQAKVLTGFDNKLQALRAYRKAYPDNPMGPVTEMKTPQLKEWLAHGDTSKPVDPRGVNRMADSRFADAPSVTHSVSPSGRSHVATTAGGVARAEARADGNLHVTHNETSHGMRGVGEGAARIERLAQEAHSVPGRKLVSDNRVSAPEQRVYDSLKARGYDVKTNPHTVDPGTGERVSKSELKPVYEVGPKRSEATARDARTADTARARPMTHAEATEALRPILERTGGEGVQVHEDTSTLPQNIREAMEERNHPNPVGVYDPATDTVHIVASNHESHEQLLRTAVHEIVGHQGLRHLLGDDYHNTMLDLYRGIADKPWIRDYLAQHGLDPRNARHKALAADEYAAHLAERDVGDPKQGNPGFLSRAIDAVRAGLRKLGLVREWTDNDVRQLLRKSANNLAAESAAIQENARWKNENNPRFADKDSGLAEQYPSDHPLAVAHKFGKTMEDQANYNPGFVRSRLDFLEKSGATAKDHGLAFIGLRNLKDFMPRSLMPSLHQFIRTHDQMDGRRGQLMQKAVDVARPWSQWISKNKDKGAALGELMHASTLGGVDPSKAFASRYRPEDRARDATKAAHDDMRKELHGRLKQMFDKDLDDTGRELFNTVRDHYAQNREDVLKALTDRIEQSGAADKTKKQLMADLRLKFETGKVEGPYFPLARFGNHWASAKDAQGNTVSFSRFETRAQKKAWIENAKARGFAVDGGEKNSDKSMMERIDPDFVKKVTEMTKDIDPGLADDIWQEYLKAMPEMSMRKHFIHRAGRLGYSMDAMRAFAHNSFHSAHQLARLEYGHRLDTVMDSMGKEQQALNTADPTSSNASWAAALHREMGRRYEWIKNPRSSPLASQLTKFGFGWYLGAAPATAFRIFSQNPMLAQPVLAGHHGQIGATRELLKASAQWATSKGSLGDTLRGDERRAFDTAADMGVFSNTNTQMLASGGSGDPMFTGAGYHISKAAGFMFNAMEHHNRMTTYLAAYRLGVKQGLSHDAAVDHANDLTWDSHFDYTNANRPRVLQNDAAKVALLFKQYSWGVTYRLAREFRNTINGDLPGDQRALAAKTFGGLLARQMMFSGVTGLPLYWLAESVANAVLGDKDRPFDMTAAGKKLLADHLGQRTADAIATGPVGAVSGASLSGGASYSDLWYREPSRDLTAPQYATDALGQLAGAIAAVPLNAATGAQMMHEGHIERGLEHFVPPEAASLMKAYRYNKEGVTNLKGEQVLTRDQLNDKDLFLQAIGFTPQKVADAYAQNTALKNVSKAITDRRAEIINKLAVAASVGDSEMIDEGLQESEHFDQVNPGVAIKDAKSIVNAARNLLKDQAESVNGVKLPPGLSDLYGTYGAQPKEGTQ